MSNSAALAAAIGGSVVGLAGIAFGWLNSRGERAQALRLNETEHEHQRELARGERLHDELHAAYSEMLGLVSKLLLFVERTKPMLVVGEPLDPPSLPEPDEMLRIRGRASLVGSEEVVKALDELAVRFRAFQGAAWSLDLHERQNAPNVGQGWEAVESKRERFREQVAEIERITREDIRR
jgi:hypothetical protein